MKKVEPVDGIEMTWNKHISVQNENLFWLLSYVSVLAEDAIKAALKDYKLKREKAASTT